MQHLTRTVPALLLALAACSSDPEPSASSSSKDGGGAGLGAATFKEGVMPILGESCALTACHAAKQSNLGIHITFDPALVYSELQKESPSYPGVKFVVAGKPEQSLVMAKMDGTHGKLDGCTSGCGSEMPPDELLPKEKRDLVRAWIQSGAKND